MNDLIEEAEFDGDKTLVEWNTKLADAKSPIVFWLASMLPDMGRAGFKIADRILSLILTVEDALAVRVLINTIPESDHQQLVEDLWTGQGPIAIRKPQRAED